MITHDIALASGIAQKMVVLKDGAIVESGPADTVVTDPKQPYTRTLLAACLSVEDVA
jgi:ABC-type dipeptide/oligopeptide/nickel transport system ATPase component